MPNITRVTENLGSIDPANLTPQQALVLGKFLAANPDLTCIRAPLPADPDFYPPPETYNPELRYVHVIGDRETTYIFKVTKDIFLRSRASDTNQKRFEIIEKGLKLEPVGVDARFVYLSQGNLSFQRNGSVKYKAKKRIVKLNREYENYAELECNLTSEVGYMHTKPTTTVAWDIKKLSKIKEGDEERLRVEWIKAPFRVQVMKFINGELYRDIARIDRAQEISSKTRVKLTINLLRELEKLHEKNIIHRDIRSENVIADVDLTKKIKKANYPDKNKATIFDFGLSIKKGASVNDLSGTAIFRAPEQIKEPFGSLPYDAFIDVFGVGRTLASLWRLLLITQMKNGDKKFTRIDGDYNRSGYFTEAEEEENFKSDSEYDRTELDQITGLLQEDKDKIFALIKRMTRLNYLDRPTIHECLDYFEDLLFRLRLSKKQLSQEIQESKIRAYRVAKNAERALNLVAINTKMPPKDKLREYKRIILDNFILLDSDPIAAAKFLGMTAPYFKRLPNVAKFLQKKDKNPALAAKALEGIENKFLEIEIYYSSEYKKENLIENQAYVEKHLITKWPLVLKSSTEEEKEAARSFAADVFNLNNSLKAAIQKSNKPNSLTEFIDTNDKRIRKYCDYLISVERLRARANIEKLCNLSKNFATELGTLFLLLKHNKPLKTTIKEETPYLLNHIDPLLDKYEADDGRDISKLREINDAADALLKRYDDLVSSASKQLAVQTESLKNKFSLFRGNYAVKNKMPRRDLIVQTTDLKKQLESRSPSKTEIPDKTLAYNCNSIFSTSHRVLRNGSLQKFAPLFVKIDQYPSCENPELQQMRDRVVDAVEKYLYTSLASSGKWLNFRLNMLFNLRAASNRRIENMHYILNCVCREKTVEDLTRVIEEYLPTITRRTPNSALARLVNEAIKPIVAAPEIAAVRPS